jgi:phosphoribosylanthranilate isomerase
VFVQIYTAQEVGEALALADLGVDHVGVTPTQLGLPGEVVVDRAVEIVAALRGRATSVALSVDEDVDAVVDMVRVVRPDVLHLCGDIEKVTPDEVAQIRRRIGPVRVMQAIPMVGAQAIEQAAEFATVSDMLILDSDSAEIGGIGATGAVHDWSLSAEIVNSVDIPVILAGGLSPDNVAEAIDLVRPWGVDSLTHTNRLLPDGGFRKDLQRVEAFVSAARSAGARLTAAGQR